jgi:hypothetical protein
MYMRNQMKIFQPSHNCTNLIQHHGPNKPEVAEPIGVANLGNISYFVITMKILMKSIKSGWTFKMSYKLIMHPSGNHPNPLAKLSGMDQKVIWWFLFNKNNIVKPLTLEQMINQLNYYLCICWRKRINKKVNIL